MLSRIFNRLFPDPDGTMQLILRLLRENFHDHVRKYCFAFLFMGITAAATGLSAWIMRDVIDQLFVNKDMQMVFLVASTVIAIFLVKGFATYGQTVLLNQIGNAIVATCQNRIFNHLQKQGLGFFHDYATSDLVTRLTHNANAARTVLDVIVTRFFRDLLTVIGLAIVMLVQDPLLSVLAVFIGAPAIYLVTRVIKKIKKVAKQEFLSLSTIVGVVQEASSGIRIIKSFQLEPVMNKRMKAATSSVEEKANKIAKLKARTGPIMESLGGVSIGIFILYGGWRTIEGSQTPGEFVSFLTAMLMAYEPAKRLAKLHGAIEQGIVGVRLMYEVLDTPVAVDQKPDARPLALSKTTVAFNHVDFSYGSDSPVLSDLSLIAEGGKTTALVGPSGSGKSTLINLVQRFHDVTGGDIQIDDQNISDLTTDSLRQAIAYVSQDTYLFSGSIRENIRLGRDGATDDEIEAAARHAFAHDFISQLDNGYDTEVGENGSQLSGGQKQRVAIARAMLKDAPILVLDEATSALDSESETKVQAAFDELMKGRTVLVIAHRLSTIRMADKIAVISGGRVVEEGTHQELLAKKSHYAALHNLQFDAA